jgi:hypothetical protein
VCARHVFKDIRLDLVLNFKGNMLKENLQVHNDVNLIRKLTAYCSYLHGYRLKPPNLSSSLYIYIGPQHVMPNFDTMLKEFLNRNEWHQEKRRWNGYGGMELHDCISLYILVPFIVPPFCSMCCGLLHKSTRQQHHPCLPILVGITQQIC